MATALRLSRRATLPCTDAIISPGGTGLLYVGTSSRVTFAARSPRGGPSPPLPREEIAQRIGDVRAQAEADVVALPTP